MAGEGDETMHLRLLFFTLLQKYAIIQKLFVYLHP